MADEVEMRFSLAPMQAEKVREDFRAHGVKFSTRRNTRENSVHFLVHADGNIVWIAELLEMYVG